MYLERIGDFEIGVRWQWKIPFHTLTLCVVVTIFVSLLLLAAGFFYLWIQFSQLSEIHSEIRSELAEVKSLTEAMNIEKIAGEQTIRNKRAGSTRRGKELNKGYKERKFSKRGKNKSHRTALKNKHLKGIYFFGDLLALYHCKSGLVVNDQVQSVFGIYQLNTNAFVSPAISFILSLDFLVDSILSILSFLGKKIFCR